MICFIKIKLENMEMTQNIRLFTFCMRWLYSFVNICHIVWLSYSLLPQKKIASEKKLPYEWWLL